VVVVGGDGVDENDLRIPLPFCEIGGVNRAALIPPACRRTLPLH